MNRCVGRKVVPLPAQGGGDRSCRAFQSGLAGGQSHIRESSSGDYQGDSAQGWHTGNASGCVLAYSFHLFELRIVSCPISSRTGLADAGAD
jgi:hypothetical protein